MNNKRTITWVAAAVLLLVLAAGGAYYFLHNFTITKQTKAQPRNGSQDSQQTPQADLVTVRLYYPAGGRLEVTEKPIPRRIRTSAVAEAVIEEFFRLPVNADAVIPAQVKLLGLYRDAVQTLYVDLSDELRRNFHADALSEYLLLQGLYETVVSNIPDIRDVKVLVEGREIETLGGHVLLRYPLKNTVGAEVKAEVNLADEQ